MNYDLAKKLKDAGFKQEKHHAVIVQVCKHGFGTHIDCKCSNDDYVYTPNLSELIEACGKTKSRMSGNIHKDVKQVMYFCLEYDEVVRVWKAGFKFGNLFSFENSSLKKILLGQGKTPEEAVANLWLELNKNA